MKYASICDVLIMVLKFGGINAHSFSISKTILQLPSICTLSWTIYAECMVSMCTGGLDLSFACDFCS